MIPRAKYSLLYLTKVNFKTLRRAAINYLYYHPQLFSREDYDIMKRVEVYGRTFMSPFWIRPQGPDKTNWQGIWHSSTQV